MQGALTAIIAVVGTLLGSVVTYQFQRRSADHAERTSFLQQLRLERMQVYTDFAGAITEYRRGQHDWWNRKNEDPNNPRVLEARVEAYRLRGVALHGLVRVQLVTSADTLLNEARHTYELTSRIHRAANATELGEWGMEARNALEHFIEFASLDIQRYPTPVLSPRRSGDARGPGWRYRHDIEQGNEDKAN
jgi:sensor domain CHASE-containing protein